MVNKKNKSSISNEKSLKNNESIMTPMSSVIASEPVVAAESISAPEPVVASEPVVATESISAPEPVVAAELVQKNDIKKQKGGKKKNIKSLKIENIEDMVEQDTPIVSTPIVSSPKSPVKKIRKKKQEVVTTSEIKENIELNTNEELDDKSRSFKVKLPGDEDYSGRFTGLTPYQAANKALSKFFRTSDNTNISTDHILFSIKESTRGSKRHEYTYKGTRLKLEQPITYTIKSLSGEERVITKQYKNQLIKIKKNIQPVQSVQPIASA